jgi:hypothetical protein
LVIAVPTAAGIALFVLRGFLRATAHLILCCLAAQATHVALRGVHAGPGAKDLRAHRLAVLQSVLSALSEDTSSPSPPGPRPHDNGSVGE